MMLMRNTLESTRNGNRIQIKMLQGSVWKCLLVTSLLLFPVRGSAPKCCEGEASWIQSRNCTSGSRFLLKCPKHFFKANPEIDTDDVFYVQEEDNTSYLIFGNKNFLTSYKIAPDRYCLTRLSPDRPIGQIALICIDEDMLPAGLWRSIYFGTLSIISCLFLVLTLFIYIILRELRDVQDKALISMMAAFLVSFFFNANLHLEFIPDQGPICLIAAFTMYYAYLSAFFWLNIISLNIWRTVWFPSFNIKNDLLYKIYSVIGWGLPLCFLVVTITTHNIEGPHIKPGFGDMKCWFNGPRPTWIYFYGPIIILLTMNLCYLSLTSVKLWYKFKGKNCSKLRVLRFKCLMCVKLAVIMGITWIFEVISFAFGDMNYIYWIVPDTLNVLQGFFIFILLVVFRKRVRKLLARRRPCNIPFPKSWTAYSDEENYEIVMPEELELSQTS